MFIPVANSEGGVVDQKTIFVFRQNEHRFTASYSGGKIIDGHILGAFDTDKSARMLYHCLTKSGVLKTGQANARFGHLRDGRLGIVMEWEWLKGDEGKGQSRYEELLKDDVNFKVAAMRLGSPD